MNKELIDKLERALSPKRYAHSIGVRDEAVRLAGQYNADVEKAYIAGYLHDCAKGLKVNDQIEKCKEYGIELDAVTLACAPVIHAPLGAVMAKAEYAVCDEEILEAIRCHTVAKRNMTLLGKIIYVADMIEPSRDFPGVDTLRAAAYDDIDKAFVMCLEQSIVFNAKKHKPIHPDTLEAWNYMLIYNGVTK